MEKLIFDTHAHYDDRAFDADRDEILSGLGQGPVGAVVNVAADMDGVRATAELVKKYPMVFGALGVHPDMVCGLSEENMAFIEKAAGHEKIVAVGEIGLDYHEYGDEKKDREAQKLWFERQLFMAEKLGLPVIIHSRDAAEDTLEILKRHPAKNGGVVHCFSYSTEYARECIRLGFHIGVGGVVTFSNGRKLKAVAGEIPMESIVLETDCPYLSPVPHRGERNSSLNLPLVVSALAAIRGLDEREIIEKTWDNAVKLYRIDNAEGIWKRKSWREAQPT